MEFGRKSEERERMRKTKGDNGGRRRKSEYNEGRIIQVVFLIENILCTCVCVCNKRREGRGNEGEREVYCVEESFVGDSCYLG